MSNQFDRHPFDNALTHNAQLKVGGLESSVPVPEFAAGPLATLQQIAREMAAATEARERTLSDLRNELASAQYVIGKREVEIEKLKKDVDDLNRLLRSVGWGQGEIDSSATVAEESEAKDAEIARYEALVKSVTDAAHAANAELRAEIEKLKTGLQDADRINNELCGVIVRNAQRTAALSDLLKLVPHTCFGITESEYPGQTNLLHGGAVCPRCAYEKLLL